MAAQKKLRQLAPDEIAGFCQQLAVITQAGIPAQEGLYVMLEDTSDKYSRELLQQMIDALEMGEPLSAAVAQCGRFPDYVADMLQVGEGSGRIDQVLAALAEHYQRTQAIHQGIKDAILYPSVMVAMMLVVLGVLVIKVLPVFRQVFLQLGSDMSPLALGLMHFGAALSQNAVWVLLAVLVLAVLYLVLRATPGGRKIGAVLSRHCFKKLRRATAMGRFASCMSLTLASGLDTDQSLEMCQRLVEDPDTAQKIQRARQLMQGGDQTFIQAMSATGLFGGLQLSMLTVAAKAGAIDTVMAQIAAMYQQEVERRTDGLIGAIEPTVVAVLSILVGMILLSVILPLMGVMASL